MQAAGVSLPGKLGRIPKIGNITEISRHAAENPVRFGARYRGMKSRRPDLPEPAISERPFTPARAAPVPPHPALDGLPDPAIRGGVPSADRSFDDGKA